MPRCWRPCARNCTAPGWACSWPRAGGPRRTCAQAADLGADLVRIAAHCTEADVTERHLGVARALGLQAHAVLLMSHMAAARQLAEQCARLASYGAQAVGIFDSAGHYLPGDVTERIAAIAAAVDVPVIFHGHNNLGMAVANSVAAVDAGATIIDGCARGFGAGAGNTQLEVLVAVLERLGHRTGIDLYRLLDAADLAEQRLMPAAPTIDSASLVSGLAGVFSGFKPRVLEVARRQGVDPRDLFFEPRATPGGRRPGGPGPRRRTRPGPTRRPHSPPPRASRGDESTWMTDSCAAPGC